MANYTRISNYTQKTVDGDPVLAAEHDAEFVAIQTAIGTKADKVSGGTNQALLEIDGNGNLVDSTILTSRVEGLSEALTTSFGNKADIDSTSVTDWTRIGQGSRHDVSETNSDQFVFTSVTENTWTSVGPTDSGADIETTALDVLPSDARILLVELRLAFELTGQETAGTDYTLDFYLTDGDSSDTTKDANTTFWRIAHTAMDNTAGIELDVESAYLYVPLNASQVFRILWDDNDVGSTASSSLSFTPRAWFTD